MPRSPDNRLLPHRLDRSPRLPRLRRSPSPRTPDVPFSATPAPSPRPSLCLHASRSQDAPSSHRLRRPVDSPFHLKSPSLPTNAETTPPRLRPAPQGEPVRRQAVTVAPLDIRPLHIKTTATATTRRYLPPRHAIFLLDCLADSAVPPRPRHPPPTGIRDHDLGSLYTSEIANQAPPTRQLLAPVAFPFHPRPRHQLKTKPPPRPCPHRQRRPSPSRRHLNKPPSQCPLCLRTSTASNHDPSLHLDLQPPSPVSINKPMIPMLIPVPRPMFLVFKLDHRGWSVEYLELRNLQGTLAEGEAWRDTLRLRFGRAWNLRIPKTKAAWL